MVPGVIRGHAARAVAFPGPSILDRTPATRQPRRVWQASVRSRRAAAAASSSLAQMATKIP